MSLSGRAHAWHVQGPGMNPQYLKMGRGNQPLKTREHKFVDPTKMCTQEFYELLRGWVPFFPSLENTVPLFSNGEQESEVSWKAFSFPPSSWS